MTAPSVTYFDTFGGLSAHDPKLSRIANTVIYMLENATKILRELFLSSFDVGDLIWRYVGGTCLQRSKSQASPMAKPGPS